MNGADQEFFTDTGALIPGAARVSALLGRCVKSVGPEPGTAELAASLALGDRETLLLHIRRATFGDKLEPVVRCPSPNCGQPMDAPMSVTALLPVPPEASLPEYQECVSKPDGRRLRFRLPTGTDQEAVADLAQKDPIQAARILASRCADGAELNAAEVEQLGEAMAALDPYADLRLSLQCPDCGQAFMSLFDTGAYLFEETLLRSPRLYEEVHTLAFYYHWSEAEILALPATKRRCYLELLQRALG